jgi:GT2 family glycosyltransferase
MNPLISIVIVNWNGRENLKECLVSLSGIDYSNYEVILVDNGSVDGSVSFVEKQFPKIKIIESGRNLGFAGGNNLGYEKSKGEYILFLNNDTIVTKNFLRKLVNFIEDKKNVAIVQPKILFHKPGADMHHKVNSAGSFLLNTGFLYHLNYGKKDVKNDHPYDIFSACGACFLARRSVIEEVGLFDSDYFAYFEETDFCHRVWMAGYSVVLFPSVFIYHKGGETARELSSAFVQYHSFKNRIFSYLKNLGMQNLMKIIIPHLILCEIISLTYLLMGKIKYFAAIQRAIFWNIFNVKKIIRERGKTQNNIRKIRDDNFIPRLTRHVGINYYRYLFSGILEKYVER